MDTGDWESMKKELLEGAILDIFSVFPTSQIHSHSKYGLETQLKSLFYLFVRLYAILCTVHGH